MSNKNAGARRSKKGASGKPDETCPSGAMTIVPPRFDLDLRLVVDNSLFNRNQGAEMHAREPTHRFNKYRNVHLPGVVSIVDVWHRRGASSLVCKRLFNEAIV
ncbi:hypothetical protein [Rosistilla oblonga]|uniref:hypothetical protein n=1 Tax=Rosistilla oblonga TaxID=2527990 RepID=UPI003A968F0A